MALNILRTIHTWFRPSIDAIFARNIPFSLRWRMLVFLQPTVLLTNSIVAIPWLFSRAFTAEYITVDNGQTLRILVYKRPRTQDSAIPSTTPRPLHLDLHSGAFMGGIPEASASFCDALASTTGAVVVSADYRVAPKHGFPAAIDDVDAVVRYLHAHAAQRWGADPKLMTIGGFSAGANLALAATQQPCARRPAPTALKASVTFYAPIDIGLRPQQKPLGPGFTDGAQAGKVRTLSRFDPSVPLLPLMDAYATAGRANNLNDPRFSPITAEIDTLPDDMLLIVPAIDILVHEQLTFVQRVKDEIERDPVESKRVRSVEAVVFDKGFHGWIELPASVAGPTRQEAIDLGVNFIKKIHRKYGFYWN